MWDDGEFQRILLGTERKGQRIGALAILGVDVQNYFAQCA